jgi:hypothetical protein
MFILHNNRQEWDLISEAVTPLLDGQEWGGEKVLPSVKLIQWLWLWAWNGFWKDLLNAWSVLIQYTIMLRRIKWSLRLEPHYKIMVGSFFMRLLVQIHVLILIPSKFSWVKGCMEKRRRLNRVPELDKELPFYRRYCYHW